VDRHRRRRLRRREVSRLSGAASTGRGRLA
jgi:hypothetical protein